MTTLATPSLATETEPPLRPRPWRAAFAWLLVIIVLAEAIHLGIELRRWLWDQTTSIRFINSVSNAIEWGRYANQVGVYQLYDKLVNEKGEAGEFSGPARFTLDYPPLRLVIAATWADWAERNFPPPKGRRIEWQPDYEFTEPMLRGNLYCEIAAMLAMFLLVREWVRQCAAGQQRPFTLWQAVRGRPRERLQLLTGVAKPPFRLRLKTWWKLHCAPRPSMQRIRATRGLFAATVAALLVWFNPAMIWNAQVYPQWDAWLLPAFLFAVFFALRNWWLAAGLIMGGCAMAKGQILFVAPVIIAWPILRGYPWAAVRLLVGFISGVAVVIWPWLFASDVAVACMTRVLWGSVVLLPLFRLPRKGAAWKLLRVGIAALGFAVIAAPWFYPYSNEYRLYGLAFAALLAVMAYGLPWRWALEWAACAWAGGTFLLMPLCGASTAWLTVGLMYGTRHWKQLYWCQASNLGSILQERFGWKYRANLRELTLGIDSIDLADYIPWIDPYPMLVKDVMTWIFVLCLPLCIIGLVLHHRRRDMGFFYALMAPWLLAYAVLPQMIERYLMWPAVVCAAAASVRIGGLLMYLALSVMAWIMMFHYMLRLAPVTSQVKQDYWPILNKTFPAMGWGVLLLAAVSLCLSLRKTPVLKAAD